MKKVIGIVQTEPSEDAGRIVFRLLLDNERLTPCRSGAGYKSPKPKMGERVAVTGDTIRDMKTGGESFDFFYTLLEIVPPVAAERAV